MLPQIPKSWKTLLESELGKKYFQTLRMEVEVDYLINDPSIYPPAPQIFNALKLCPLDTVKAVILGQDPYHGKGQAMGLSFSVPEGMQIPPSLRNVYKEIYSDLGCPIPESGNLTRWAKQGVLLLNSTLTVAHKKPGSHQDKGWEIFTDAVIEKISAEQKHCVFLLWGAYAGDKSKLIDESKHLVLKAPHPSPLSAYRGFLGCKHFSKANTFLRTKGLPKISW